MPTATAVFVGLVVALLVQRVVELRIAKRNEAWARSQGAREYGARHYPLFFVLHGGWGAAWIVEGWLRGPSLVPGWWAWLTLFVLAQGLRYWAITTLGRRWNTRILVLPHSTPIRTGPYRFLSHPNYLAVIVELWVVPAIVGAWITAAVASVLNLLLLLAVRIPAEERALRAAAPQQGDRREPSSPSAERRAGR